MPSHQVYSNNIIEEIQSLFKKEDYTRDMRDDIQFILPRPRSNIERSSFKYRAALVWNNLPVDPKVTSYDSFKKRLPKNSKTLERISFNNLSFKQRDNHFNYFRTIFKLSNQIDDSAKDGGPHFTQCMIGICPLATHSYQN